MLKKQLFLTLALIAAGLAVPMPVPAQIVKSGALFNQPKRLKLNGLGEPRPQGKKPTYNTLMTESFYPIGWSDDGKFAYYVEPPDEACGCYYADLVIEDLKTDKILWEDKYSGSRSQPVNPNETIKDHWRDKQKLFSEKLAEYGIKQQTEFDLRFPLLRFEKDVLTPRLDVKLKSDDGLYVDGFVRLSIVSRLKGSKTIYEQKYTAKEISGIQNAEFSGALLSPYEARAALVVVEVYRGYEGPPNTTRIRIVGSTLTTGFRQSR